MLEKLLERVYAAEVDGVYLCGSTGAGIVLAAAERRKVVEVAARNSPAGKQIIVHVGAWSFAETAGLARHAERAGASAISALPPAGVSYDELIAFYRSLAAVTSLPPIAYYFPVARGPLTQSQLEQLCRLPGVVGLKFTDYDLYTLSMLSRAGKVMFNGRDEVLAAGLLLGATGGIGSFYNLMPSLFVDVYRLSRQGRWEAARAVQDRITDVIQLVTKYPFPAALKQIMTWEGIDCGPALPPRLNLTSEQKSELQRSIRPLLETARGMVADTITNDVAPA